MTFKCGDKVVRTVAPGKGLKFTVLEVDTSGNIRIENAYPPIFHLVQSFEIDTVSNVTAIGTATTGIKHDQDKVDMSLLSPIALEKVAQVMTFGKKKYSAHNWRGGFLWSRPLAAALRHILAYMGGQDKDPETGLSHLAHAACCIMFLLEFEETHRELDDRFKTEVKNA